MAGGGAFRCDQCADAMREVAATADELAFWACQAKHFYAVAWQGKAYDQLSRKDQDTIEKTFERFRREENAERYGHAEPPREIGS